MPMKITVGWLKKIGQPDYGSLGANCNVEFEADQALLQKDPKDLHKQVQHAFTACRQAVEEELARQQGGEASKGLPGDHAPAAAANPVPRTVTPSANNNGNGSSHNGVNGRSVSEKQLEYARQLARQITGLGVRRLETLAQKMYGKPLAGLSSLDGSGLIDTLKGIKGGEIDLEQVLKGTVA
jgi:hypothetical protein